MPHLILKRGDFGSLMSKKIAELEARSGVRLGLVQRILLAETGTVEQILSILTDSTIRVKVVEQKENAKTITRPINPIVITVRVALSAIHLVT